MTNGKLFLNLRDNKKKYKLVLEFLYKNGNYNDIYIKIRNILTKIKLKNKEDKYKN